MTAQERITEWAESAALAPSRTRRERQYRCICNCHSGDGATDHISTGKCYCRADLSGEAVPAMAAALAAVLELHQPQERCHDGDGSWSVTRDEWDADYDGDPEVFLVCGHCGAIEMHESTEAGSDHSYLDALWPCPTVAAIETALEASL